MGRILGIIEILPGRSPAPPPPPSPLLTTRRLGGCTPLDLLIDRLQRIERLNDLAVITDESQAALAAEQLANRLPLHTYDGHKVDALACLANAARHASADSVVRLIAGHPFVDPLLIDRLLDAAQRRSRCDYVAYFTGAGRRALLARLGMIVEWMSATAVERAARAATDPDDRQDASRYVHSHPELFHLRLLPLTPPFDRRDMRLSLEHDEDWEHAQVIWEALGADGLTWPSIAELVGNSPALRARMERLNRADRV